jgi:hypothetical protein
VDTNLFEKCTASIFRIKVKYSNFDPVTPHSWESSYWHSQGQTSHSLNCSTRMAEAESFGTAASGRSTVSALEGGKAWGINGIPGRQN